MSTLTRRRSAFIGLAGVSLAAAGFLAPGAFAAESINGDVTVTNTETVQVLMGANGNIDAQRIYEQLILKGKGRVDISNPVSEDGLRNLDGFGRFDVRDGKMRVNTGVDGKKMYRSVSNFTKKLPVDVDITYTLNGKKVKPGDIVGKSGDLEVRYDVKNVTGKQQDVTFPDGKGDEQTRVNAVVVPIVGSLTTTLPPNFTRVKSEAANAAGDGRGGTQMSFTMTLFPPIGSDRATVGYTARITDGVVPKATLSVLPINPLESPSFKGGAASYKGGAESGADLTAGATTIDSNLLKIRDGANDLVAGILQLKDGADQLSAGLNNDAAPGARKLAAGGSALDAGASKLKAGTGDLSDGAGKLNAGAGSLSDGLKSAKAGGPQLLDGVAQLKDGAQLVDAGLTTLNSQVVPGAGQISAGASGLLAAISGSLVPNLDGLVAKADSASAAVNSSPTMDAGEKGAILTDIGTAKAIAQGVKAALTSTNPTSGFTGALTGIKGGADQIGAGVDAQTSAGAAGTPNTLKNGMAQLIGGLTQLQSKGGELVDGIDQLSAGADQLKGGTGDLKAGAGKLNAGAGDLKAGTGQLSAGAGELADGLGTAAAGSGKLADGLGQAADSAPALPEGAQKLSDEGTSQLVNVGNATAMDYGLKYALIEAGAERAQSAQPYGSPQGANELTAYTFEIAGEDGATSANLKRGAAAVVLLAGAGALAAVRRRGLI